jgi:hypothetical protein
VRNKLTRWMAACGLVVAFAASAPSALAQNAPVEVQVTGAPGEMKPLAAVVFASYEELMKDIDFLGSLNPQVQQGGAPASQMVEQTLQMFTQNKGLAGLDKSKPIGVIVQTDGQMPAGAVCIPVTDLNALLDVVKGFQVTVADAGNGLQQLSTQQGQSVFLKPAGGWALISMMPQMLEALPEDPMTVLGPLAEDYDLAARIHVQNVPETFKHQAVDAMSQGAEGGMTQNDEESDEDFAERKRLLQAQLDQLKQFINELDQVTVGLAIDNQEQRAFLDFAYTAQPGTKLAEQIAANSNVTTNFAGFVQPDAAMTLSFASKMTAADTAQLDQMIESLRTQASKAIDEDDDLQGDAGVKSGVNDFIDAIKATMQSGTMDGGASLDVAADSLTFVAGGFIADPAKVESGLKKIAEAAQKKEEDMPEVKWASSKHKDVTFHTMQAPVPEEEEEARQLFGETLDLAVGIGQKAVYFAAGRDAIDAVKKVIDDSAANPSKPTAPMEMTVALGQIMKAAQGLADEDDKPQIEMIAGMLENEAKGRDHIRMLSQPIENGIRMRIEAEEGVLRAIGMAAMQAQMQGAGGF